MQISVLVPATFAPSGVMVTVDFFAELGEETRVLSVKQALSADRANAFLSYDYFTVAKSQVFTPVETSFRPIQLQGRIVRRVSAFNHNMSFDGGPGKPGQVSPGAFVAKNPVILTFQLEAPPVLCNLPLNGFVRVSELSPSLCPFEHPVVHKAECLAGHANPEVIRPAPNYRVERLYDVAYVMPFKGNPFFT